MSQLFVIVRPRGDKQAEGCSMSAQELAGGNALSSTQKQALLSQLEATEYDDFDLVYERLIQLTGPMV